MIIQQDVMPFFEKRSDYDDRADDALGVDGVFASLLVDACFSVPQMDEMPIISSTPSVIPSEYRSDEVILNAQANADPLVSGDDSLLKPPVQDLLNIMPGLSDFGMPQTEVSSEQSIGEMSNTDTHLIRTKVITSTPPRDEPIKSMANVLPNDLQELNMKGKQSDNSDSQKTDITHDDSQMIVSEELLMEHFGTVKSRAQKASLTVDKTPGTTSLIEPSTATSFKNLFNQSNTVNDPSSTAVGVSKEVEKAMSYEVHYEPNQNINALGNKANLRIHQEGLGSIDVKIEMNHQQSSVTLVADTNETKQIIQAHLAHLKTFFSDAHINLAQANIDYQSPQEQSSQQQKHQISADGSDELMVVDRVVSERKNYYLIDTYV